MVRISPPIRISFGLVLLTISVLLIGDMLGLVPNHNNIILESRARLSESLAVQISTAITHQETAIIPKIVEVVTKRNNDILSIAVKLENGNDLIVVGDHNTNWPDDLDLNGRSTPTHIEIPLFSKQKPWGVIEVVFAPLNDGGFAVIYQHPLFKIILFTMFSCFVGYLLFIKKTLKELDPSKVIPDRVKATLNLLAEGVIILDDRENILLANSNFAKKVGLSESELIGKNVSLLDWEDPRTGEKPEETPWQQSTRNNVNCISMPLILKREGSMSAFMVNSSPILDSDSNMRGAIATFDDVTELEKKNADLAKSLSMLRKSRAEIQSKNKKLEVLATRDPLTGCFNRRAFFSKFEAAFKLAVENNNELSCIMLDIDHFKAVNDDYGHQKGDEVLKSIAAVLNASVRGDDTVGRYGGEEFCIFIQNASNTRTLELAERLRKDIEENAYPSLKVTSSFGVSSTSGGAISPNELIAQADEMLYISKEQGRNCVSSWASREQLIRIMEQRTEQVKADAGVESEAHVISGENARDQLIEKIKRSVLETALVADEEIHTGAVLLLGLDRFGRINETLGHTIGDAVLKEIGRRLSDSFRNSDAVISIHNEESDTAVSHIAADEFAIVLAELESVEIIPYIVRRTLDLVAKTIEVDGNEIYITSSIGVSIFPDDSEDATELLKNAAVALNQSKGAGGNTFQFYNTEMDKDASLRLRLESHLYRAIERDEFVLYYQPKVNMKSGMITSFEALIRWNHPEIGMVSPGLFIPIAEEDGLIAPIGNWVLKKAIEQVKAWREMGYPDIMVAFNLAARQMQSDRIFEEIISIVEENNGDPSWIEIEVTETGLMLDMEQAVVLVRKFREYGFSVAIDDFGTGYSSLNYIKQFDLTTLKIDRSFVKELAVSGQDRYIVTAIVELAKTMNLKVVAEGIETEEQFELLKVIGCDEMQGFLFSPPVPADKATKLLHSNRNTISTTKKMSQSLAEYVI